MRLGALLVPHGAQLDGFKSRALRAEAPTQRHLYTTEWRRLEVACAAGAEVLAAATRDAVDAE